MIPMLISSPELDETYLAYFLNQGISLPKSPQYNHGLNKCHILQRTSLAVLSRVNGMDYR